MDNPTFQQGLVFRELCRVLQFAELLGFLGHLLALQEGLSLVADEFGGRRVQLGHQRRQVDVWERSASRFHPTKRRDSGIRTPPC